MEFLKKHGARIRSIAESAAANCHVHDDDLEAGLRSFDGVIAFLSDNNASISAVKSDFGTEEFLKKAASRYFKGRARSALPSKPKTVPDKMASVVMREAFGHEDKNLARLAETHQEAMASENAVGDLLERYIASTLEDSGWYWCSGTLVRAVDFLRYDETSHLWESLQVKNSDNSENSSSASVRNGTPIKHWFRTFAATGDSNWDAFPADAGARGKLSEEGFENFVEAHYKKLKSEQR